MAHKKAGGSTANVRDSAGQRLGIKIFGGQIAIPGNIIVRQRGTKFHKGNGVRLGRDHTIFATLEGVVRFTKKKVKGYTGKLATRTFVHVEPKSKK